MVFFWCSLQRISFHLNLLTIERFWIHRFLFKHWRNTPWLKCWLAKCRLNTHLFCCMGGDINIVYLIFLFWWLFIPVFMTLFWRVQAYHSLHCVPLLQLLVVLLLLLQLLVVVTFSSSWPTLVSLHSPFSSSHIWSGPFENMYFFCFYIFRKYCSNFTLGRDQYKKKIRIKAFIKMLTAPHYIWRDDK